MIRPADGPGTPVAEPGPGRRPPTHPILDLTDQQIEATAGMPPFALDAQSSFVAGSIETILPRGTAIRPADQFMAAIIQSSIGDRPIHFAMTTNAYGNLRLRPYLVRHGLTYRLNDGPVEEGNGVWKPTDPQIENWTGPFIDLATTDELVSNVFRHHRGFPESWNHWVDSASEGIPLYYGTTHYGLAAAYAALGDAAASEAHQRRAQAFLDLAFRREEANR
jgi:hypothetical protein